MRVLHVAPEGLPFSKTGGLADVIGGLAPALAAAGEEVAVALPLYDDLPAGAPAPRPTGTVVGGGGPPGSPARIRFEVLEAEARDVRYLLLASPLFSGRTGLYTDASGRDYADNWLRFAAFARSAGELAAGEGFDVVHCHDWQAALLPVYEEVRARATAAGRRFRTLLTIHNLAYQGVFPAFIWPSLGLPAGWFHPEAVEFYGQVNYLKGGIVAADALTTVSPTYAREILGAEHGAGLEGVLRMRRESLTGILNGVDYDEWDPRADRFVARRYGPEDVAGKADCKTDLQRTLGLVADPRAPLAAVISRMAEQKGWDLLLEALPRFVDRGLQLAMLGAGEPRLERGASDLARRYPGRAAARIGVDLELAHKIEAGADLFLMPSRYEPCGLNQMYSLRYGTVPVVRATGGLVDTVVDASDLRHGTGYVFGPYSVDALAHAVARALATLPGPHWREIQRRGMLQDFSWSVSAQAYRRLYRRLAPVAADAARQVPAADPRAG